MARRLREEFKGARHHVWDRGVRRGLIFTSILSQEVFLDHLAAFPELFGVKVHAYALMGNHYHLVLESESGRLSEAMQWLNSSYGRWFNHHTGWEGAVFSKRFSNRVVYDDADWAHLLAYVHLNPVRSGFRTDPRRSRWTSMRAYMGLEPKPEWLTTEDFIEGFGDKHRLLRYHLRVMRREEAGPDGFHGRVTAPRVSSAWLELAERPLEQGMAEVTRALGRSPLGLRELDMDEGDKSTVCWWLSRATRATQAELAPLLGYSRSVICRRVQRVEKLLARGEGELTLADLLLGQARSKAA